MVPHFRVPWRVSFGFNLIAVLISLMAKSSDVPTRVCLNRKNRRRLRNQRRTRRKIFPLKSYPQSNGRASDLTIGTRPTHSNNPQTKKGSNLGPGKQTR